MSFRCCYSRFWRVETGCQQFYPQAGKLLIFALELDRVEEIHEVWRQDVEYGKTPSVESGWLPQVLQSLNLFQAWFPYLYYMDLIPIFQGYFKD